MTPKNPRGSCHGRGYDEPVSDLFTGPLLGRQLEQRKPEVTV